MYTHACESPPGPRPGAIGFVRVELSARHAPRHAREIHDHARRYGYRYLRTVHAAAEQPNPLTQVRALATELGAGIIIVFDLGHVDNRPAILCDLGYRLETVCPQTVWMPSVAPQAATGRPI